MAWFRRDRTLKFALSTFSATFVFALVSTAQVGRRTAAIVPTRTLIAALLLTLLSIAMFLMLINRTSNGLRVASVVQEVDVEARQVFDAVYPNSVSEATAAEETARPLNELTPVQTVREGRIIVECPLVPEYHSAAELPLGQRARPVDVEQRAAGRDMIPYGRHEFDDGVVFLGEVREPGPVERHHDRAHQALANRLNRREPIQ